MLISTLSFCLGYARKCSAEQFATLRYAVVGAEKLREPIARAFKEKYGPAYGCTEMSPGVWVNAPDDPAAGTKGWKLGTVGRPLQVWWPRLLIGKWGCQSRPAPRDCSSSREPT